MNVLFVCNQGKHRSRTAAELFSKEHETRFFGIYTNLNKKDLEWVDVIVGRSSKKKNF